MSGTWMEFFLLLKFFITGQDILGFHISSEKVFGFTKKQFNITCLHNN